jgi:uncharacterized DUF497 family protein
MGRAESSKERVLLLGVSKRGRLLVIARSEHGESIRIISARRVDRKERQTL